MSDTHDDVVRKTIESYDSSAGEYTATWFHKVLEGHLRRFVGMLPGGKPVLDVGGGHGRDTLALARMGVEAVLLDLSIRLMAEGRWRGVRAPMVQADLRRMPFADGSFGGIWACASLVHLPRGDMLLALEELARVASDGGVLFLSVREGTGSGWETAPGGFERFYTYYRSEEVLGMMQAVGWQPARWQTDPPHWISVWARRGGGA